MKINPTCFMLCGLALIYPVTSSGQDLIAHDDLICAAVFPCTEKGEILSEYKNGPCSQVYQQQCSSIKVSQQAEALSGCQTERDSIIKRLKREHRQNRRLRATVKSLELQIKNG